MSLLITGDVHMQGKRSIFYILSSVQFEAALYTFVLPCKNQKTPAVNELVTVSDGSNVFFVHVCAVKSHPSVIVASLILTALESALGYSLEVCNRSQMCLSTVL